MIDRFFIVFCLLVMMIGCGFMLHQELEIKALKNRELLILAEVKDVQKKQRINAQDLDFIKKIIIEGKNGEEPF
jgi:hypothetical protein